MSSNKWWTLKKRFRKIAIDFSPKTQQQNCCIWHWLRKKKTKTEKKEIWGRSLKWKEMHIDCHWLWHRKGLHKILMMIKMLYTYLPTKFSRTELLPADWPPTTAIWGRSSCMWTPSWVKASCSLLTIGIKFSMLMLLLLLLPLVCFFLNQINRIWCLGCFAIWVAVLFLNFYWFFFYREKTCV